MSFTPSVLAWTCLLGVKRAAAICCQLCCLASDCVAQQRLDPSMMHVAVNACTNVPRSVVLSVLSLPMATVGVRNRHGVVQAS
jgi:hypothetical protein